jgi:hypothetical protein
LQQQLATKERRNHLFSSFLFLRRILPFSHKRVLGGSLFFMAFPFLVHSFPLGLSEHSQMHYWQQGKEPLPMQPGPKWLLAGVGFWSLAYAVSRLLCPRRSKDFCNRLVSMLHVALSLLLCGISVRDWSHPLDGIGGPSTFPQASGPIQILVSFFVGSGFVVRGRIIFSVIIRI